MKREVILLPRAEVQLLEAALWWCENRSPEQAFRWLDGFEAALTALRADLSKLAIAREDALFDFPFTVHQLTYGLGYRPSHRAIIEVRDSVVYVHAIRHLAQDDISPADI